MSDRGQGAVLDWAIVGGGVSGLYAAWRLSQSGASNLAVFEGTERPGGRLLSITIPGTSHTAELGAMRFAKKHILVHGLVKQLKLEVSPFSFPSAQLFLRGDWVDSRLLNCGGCDRPRGLPYRLRPDEAQEVGVALAGPQGVGNIATILVIRAMRLALGEIKGAGRLRMDQVTAEQWAQIRTTATLQGIPLRMIGFWNLLQHFLSADAVLLVRDAFGYESIVCNWNAAEAVRWFMDDFSTGYLGLKNGMQDLTTALYNDLMEKPNGWHDGHQLVRIDKKNDRFLLTFVIKEPGQLRREVRRLAKAVVLAIPKNDLQRVDFRGFDPKELSAWCAHLEAVTAHTLFKLFLAYDEPWWQGRRSSARFVTDLPVRQVYCYTPEAGKRSVVMASYNDGHYTDFWSPLISQPIWNPAQAVDPNDKPYLRDPYDPLSATGLTLRSFGASKRLIQKAHKQMEILHGDALEFPYTGLAREWRSPSTSDGWHTWNVQCQTWTVIRRVRRPVSDAMLFVCGEAYSAEQGWIEGALRSVEGVLHEIGLGEPRWLSDADYWDRTYTNYAEYVDVDGSVLRKSAAKKKGRTN